MHSRWPLSRLLILLIIFDSYLIVVVCGFVALRNKCHMCLWSVQMVRVLVWRRWNAFDCQAKSSYMSEWAHHISSGWAQVCTSNEHTNEMRTTTKQQPQKQITKITSFEMMMNVDSREVFLSSEMKKPSSAAIASCHLCLNDRAVPSTRMKDQQGKRIAFFLLLCNIIITTTARAAAAAATT